MVESGDLKRGNLLYIANNELIKVDTIYPNHIDFIKSKIKDTCMLLDTFPIPLTEDLFSKIGFERKDTYGWKGNGYDYQPETSRTEYTDFVLNEYFFARYEKDMWRKTEQDEWESETSLSFYADKWYEKNIDGYIKCYNNKKYLHELQNLYYEIRGERLNIRLNRKKWVIE